MSAPVRVQGTDGPLTLEVARSGDPAAPAVVALHGFPHTWRVWQPLLDGLADTHHVVAPDLRGLGGSEQRPEGYDARTLAGDLVGLLDALGLERASVVALDLGVRVAVQFALDHPDRLERLLVAEAVLSGVPGAEEFLAAPPWWFGFHRVPGLVESVVAGHEGEYLDFFLRAGTRGRGLDPAVRDAFVAAYATPGAMRCAAEHYRAADVDAQLLAARGRISAPVLAIGAQPVGDRLHRQLATFCDDLTGVQLEDCGHIAPLDRPEEFTALVREAVSC